MKVTTLLPQGTNKHSSTCMNVCIPHKLYTYILIELHKFNADINFSVYEHHRHGRTICARS